MNHPTTHIIDPDGEMRIILHNADAPFAQMADDMISADFSDLKLEASPNEDVPAASEDGASRKTSSTSMEEHMCEQVDTRSFCFQVSAKHMMFASPYFKKCLTGGWKESESYQQKGFFEVTAEGWDSEAFLIILRAIHGQYSYHYIPRKVTPEMLASIAAITDYYECEDVLLILRDIWISSLDQMTVTSSSRDIRISSLGRNAVKSSRDLVLWLWISWFYKLPEIFTACTSIAMSRSSNFMRFQGLPIPDRVIGKDKYY